MKRETLVRILTDRQIAQVEGVSTIPEDQLALLLIGRESGYSAISGVVKLSAKAEYLLVETKKGTQTYLEYDLLRAISFDLKEVSDRHAGFI